MASNKIANCTFYHLSISSQNGVSLQIKKGSVYRSTNGREAYFSEDGKKRLWRCKPAEGVVTQNGVWFEHPNLEKAKDLLIEEKLHNIDQCYTRIDGYRHQIDIIQSFQESDKP